MEELVSGDKEVFSNLIINIKQKLYKIARMRLSSEDDICEAVQETIVKAYLLLSNLKKSKYFKTRIIKIQINECNYLYTSKYRLRYIMKKILI